MTFNREVLGSHGQFFSTPAQLAPLLNQAEADPGAAAQTGKELQYRAEELYDWDQVTAKYEDLARRLIAGESQAGRYSGRRTKDGVGGGSLAGAV